MTNRTLLRPGPGWRNVAGPVWDHVSGIRLHVGGLARLPDGTFISARMWPESQAADRAIRIAGSRRRGLMVWSLAAARRGRCAD